MISVKKSLEKGKTYIVTRDNKTFSDLQNLSCFVFAKDEQEAVKKAKKIFNKDYGIPKKSIGAVTAELLDISEYAQLAEESRLKASKDIHDAVNDAIKNYNEEDEV